MFDLFLFLHLLTTVFAVGPLVHAATTASRGLRNADASAIAAAERTTTVYAFASMLVVVFGFALMSSEDPDHPGHAVATISDTYIWLTLLLWLVAAGVALGLVVPALRQAGEALGSGAELASSLTARVAAGGGTIALLFTAIIALMVYRPGA